MLPFILDPREAAKPGAPILRPEMNPDSNMTGNTFGAAVEWETRAARRTVSKRPTTSTW